MPTTLTGPVRTWSLNGHTRRYADLCLPFIQFIQLAEPVPFDAKTSKGSQRTQAPGHARDLGREMVNGDYVPTDWSVSVPAHLQSGIEYDEATATFRFTLDDGEVLPQTDGGHRRLALRLLHLEYEKKLGEAKTAEDRTRAEHALDQLESLPVSFKLYLDGEPQKDFSRLQAGKPVDKTLLMSLALTTDEYKDDQSYGLAGSIASILDTSRESAFFNEIRFDCKKKGELPLKTLCAEGASDLGVSLLGLARVGTNFGMNAKTLALVVCACQKTMRSKRLDLTHNGYPLALPEHGGKKGSATLYVGLAICLAYRMGLHKEGVPSDKTLILLADAVRSVFNERLGANFSGQRKRQLMGAFANEFFREESVEMHDGVPRGLLELLAPSAYNCAPLPRKKARGVEVLV